MTGRFISKACSWSKQNINVNEPLKSLVALGESLVFVIKENSFKFEGAGGGIVLQLKSQKVKIVPVFLKFHSMM